MVDVEFYDDALLIVGRGFVDELSLRSGNERCSPELYATGTTTGVGLISHTIDGDDRKTVGYSMSALYCLPGSALSLLFLCGVARLISYRCGVDKHLGSLKGHHTGCFRIPLVPAYKHTKTSYGSLYGVESKITGGEIELLVICRIVGDVHLTVFACDRSIAVENYCCVVIQSWGTFLEE